MSKADLGVALVTGASSCIGRATAKALNEAGFRVFGASRRAVEDSTDGIAMLTCDVTDDASVAKLVDEVLANSGRIDLLVNNAGIGLLGGAEESSIAQAQALFDVNLFGVLRVTNAVLPAMRRQASGRMVVEANRRSRSRNEEKSNAIQLHRQETHPTELRPPQQPSLE